MADRYLLPGFEGIRTGLTTGSADVTATGLVLAYDMETLTGIQMNDFSGLGNHGTITGTTDVAGKFGQARDFDGINNIINAGSGPTFPPGGKWTISFWIKRTTAFGIGVVFSKAFTSHTSPFYQFDIRVDSTTNLMHARLWRSDAFGIYLGTTSTVEMPLNTWMHIGVVVDLAVPIIRLYIDSILNNSSTVTTGTYVNYATATTFGHNLNLVGGGNGFVGTIDEPLVFSRALSDADIKALSRDRTRIATDNSNWSATSGGTGGASVPGTADTVKLDINSGTGTGTMNATMSVLGWNSTGYTGIINTNNQAVTIGTGGYLQGGTFQATGSVITVSGDLNIAVGTFSRGASTVVIAAPATITTPDNGQVSHFTNLTINANANLGTQVNSGIGGTLTIADGITFTIGFGKTFWMMATFSISTTGTISGGVLAVQGLASNTVFTVPSRSYPTLELYSSFQGGNSVYNLSGAITVTGELGLKLFMNDNGTGDSYLFNTNNHAVTVTDTLGLISQSGSTRPLAFAAGDSIISIGFLSSIIPIPSGYITSSVSGSWAVGGIWSNVSTSSLWDFNAPITFNGAATQTIGGTGNKNIFKGVTFTGGDKSITSDITMESLDSSDVARTLTMTNGKILTYTGSTTADKIRGLPVGGLFKLRSSLPGTPWKLNALNAGIEAMYVDVQDSDASGGAKVSANEYSINSGNNTNWLFKRPPTVTTMSGSEDVTIKLD